MVTINEATAKNEVCWDKKLLSIFTWPIVMNQRVCMPNSQIALECKSAYLKKIKDVHGHIVSTLSFNQPTLLY